MEAARLGDLAWAGTTGIDPFGCQLALETWL